MGYCSADDVIARLSLAGVLYVVDDDVDSSIDASESGVIADCIESASTEIDGALTPWIDDPRGASGNEWLRHRCVDLAAERMCERKGGGVPPSLLRSAERARELLDEVRKGRYRVPGLTYPVDSRVSATRRFGRPVVAEPTVPRRVVGERKWR